MKVVLYAASGWTGALTAHALERRGIPMILAGRSPRRLSELSARLPSRPEVRVAALDDRPALVRTLRGADVVVSCAGPYLELGDAVLEAALAARCHYLDATGEHSFLQRVYERYDDEARRRELTFCPAFAAKGALGDWGATSVVRSSGRDGPIEEVAIAYAHGLREYFQPSAGSVLSAAGQGFFKPRDDQDPGRSTARRFQFPPPFGPGLALLVPGAEDVSLPRHLTVRAVRSYLSLAPGSAVNEPWAAMSLAWLPWMPRISEVLIRGREALSATLREPRHERVDESFMVAIEVTGLDGETVKIAIATRDAYAVTADIIAHGLTALAKADVPRGVVPPSLLCDPRAALRALVGERALRVVRWRASV